MPGCFSRALARVNDALDKLLEEQLVHLPKGEAGKGLALRKALVVSGEPALSQAQRTSVYAAAMALQHNPMVVHRTLEDTVGMVKAELWGVLTKGTPSSFDRAVQVAASRVQKRLVMQV